VRACVRSPSFGRFCRFDRLLVRGQARSGAQLVVTRAEARAQLETPRPASLDPCKILPADAVSKALFLDNLTAVAGPAQDNAANGGKSRSCEYKLGDKAAGALAVTRFEGREGKPAEMVASIKKGKPGAQDVAGFADGAVYYVDEQKTATLASAKVGLRDARADQLQPARRR